MENKNATQTGKKKKKATPSACCIWTKITEKNTFVCSAFHITLFTYGEHLSAVCFWGK